MHVEFEPVVELKKALNAKRRNQEWHRETGRVNGKEENPLPYRILRGGKTEHDCEDRPNAGRPAKGECKSDNKCSPRRRAAFECVQARIGEQCFDLEDSGEVKPKKNDDRARDLYCARTWPTSVEIAPSVMKTMLKPTINAAELSITLRRRWPSVDFSSSMPAPEINET